MGKLSVTAACLAWAGFACVPAEAGITVNFENQAQYDGGNPGNAARRENIVRTFDRHFRNLAARTLPKRQMLRIDVLDVDLAGYREPFRTGLSEPPILTDATPPRFKLRYTLREGGRVLLSGTEVVRDPNYLWNPSARLSSDRFVYEKATLSNWFRDRITKRRPPRG